MIYVIGLISLVVLSIAAVIVLPALVLPVIFAYTRDYEKSLLWMKRYFRHDMALYSPLDLVYLCVINDRLDEAEHVYRTLEQKGNRGSEYFVRLWVASHRADWAAAELALEEVKKYTITSDVDFREVAQALRRRDARAIDEVYLIDMNGHRVIRPSLFRITWAVALAIISALLAIWLAVWSILEIISVV